MICIFGGTAAYHLTDADFDSATPGGAGRLAPAQTPFGLSAPFRRLAPPGGADVLFASRHGAERLARSAAFVNHRANLWAAREAGAVTVLSWNGVGGIHPDLSVGGLLVPVDLIDATRDRAVAAEPPAAARVRTPFSDEARRALLSAAEELFPARLRNRDSVYVCSEGPRLETPAEINAFERMGADVVGMTLVPEVFLAAEAGLAYASVCVVTNLASGRAGPAALRRFGPEVGREGLAICLRAAQLLQSVPVRAEDN